MYLRQFWTIYKQTKRKQQTTVSVDHVLPKIDLRIEHGLTEVENRSRFRMTHVTKIGSDFSSPKIGAGFRPCVFGLSDGN